MLAYTLLQKQYLSLHYGLKFELSTVMIICRYNIIYKIFLCVSGQGIKSLHEKLGYYVLLALTRKICGINMCYYQYQISR